MMAKIMQMLIGGCVGLAIIIFIVWMQMRTDKAEIKNDTMQFDRDFTQKQLDFINPNKAKQEKYLQSKIKKLDKELEKSERQKEEAENMERGAFDGLKQGLENHADGLEKELKSKEMVQLKRKMEGK